MSTLSSNTNLSPEDVDALQHVDDVGEVPVLLPAIHQSGYDLEYPEGAHPHENLEVFQEGRALLVGNSTASSITKLLRTCCICHQVK